MMVKMKKYTVEFRRKLYKVLSSKMELEDITNIPNVGTVGKCLKSFRLS